MEEQENVSATNTEPLPNSYLIPGAIVVAGVLIAGAVMYSNPGNAPAVKNQKEQAAVGQAIWDNLADDDPVLGNPDAPVTMVEFSDFQCPFCRRLYTQTLPQIKEQYIKTGKVKFVYRDFPLTSIHDMAQKYAEASECADEQEKFWQMHDKIFNEQEKLGSGTILDFTVSDVKRWAREVGLNGIKFDRCLDSGKYAGEVEKDFRDGDAAGIDGTPGTFINKQLIKGAVPFTQFQAVIESELSKVSK